MTRATFDNLLVRATYKGDKPAPWSGEKYPENWNRHLVTVTNIETGARTSFDFWASIASPHINTVDDVLGALECFVSDATAGAEYFEDFCHEFGYDSDSITARRIYKACCRANAKLQRVYDGDFYELYNELSARNQ